MAHRHPLREHLRAPLAPPVVHPPPPFRCSVPLVCHSGPAVLCWVDTSVLVSAPCVFLAPEFSQDGFRSVAAVAARHRLSVLCLDRA